MSTISRMRKLVPSTGRFSSTARRLIPRSSQMPNLMPFLWAWSMVCFNPCGKKCGCGFRAAVGIEGDGDAVAHAGEEPAVIHRHRVIAVGQQFFGEEIDILEQFGLGDRDAIAGVAVPAARRGRMFGGRGGQELGRVSPGLRRWRGSRRRAWRRGFRERRGGRPANGMIGWLPGAAAVGRWRGFWMACCMLLEGGGSDRRGGMDVAQCEAVVVFGILSVVRPGTLISKVLVANPVSTSSVNGALVSTWIVTASPAAFLASAIRSTCLL